MTLYKITTLSGHFTVEAPIVQYVVAPNLKALVDRYPEVDKIELFHEDIEIIKSV